MCHQGKSLLHAVNPWSEIEFPLVDALVRRDRKLRVEALGAVEVGQLP